MNTNWFLGRLQETAYAYKGTIAMETIFDKNLNQYEIDAVRRLYSKTLGKGYVPENIILFEGDSLTAGSSSEWIYMRHLYTNELWGPRVMSKLMANSGDRYADAVSRFTNQARILLIDKDYAQNIYYSLYMGLNDLANSTSAVDCFTAVSALWQMAKDAGMKVIAWTIPPSGGLTPTEDGERVIYNRLLRQNPSGYHKLVDLAATDGWRELSVTNGAYYATDHIHLTTEGQKAVAEKLVQVINVP